MSEKLPRKGTRADGTNPRALSTNPRALGTNPKAQKEILNPEEKRIRSYLSIQIQRLSDPDCLVPDFDKICDVQYGDAVIIRWLIEDYRVDDYGYVFAWPGYTETNANLGGVIHIPKSRTGRGEYQKWFTLHELQTNPEVLCVDPVEFRDQRREDD